MNFCNIFVIHTLLLDDYLFRLCIQCCLLDFASVVHAVSPGGELLFAVGSVTR